MTRILIVLLALLGSGCASYRPASVEDLPSQQRVRLRLAPEELARHIAFASGNQGFVNGRFVNFSADSATFVLSSPTAHAQVSVPRTSILALERQDPSHGRSILLTTVLVGGVAALTYLGFEGDQSGQRNPDDDITDQLVPGIRVVIPIGR